MGTVLNHRRCAEECVAMARSCEDGNDKSLWLTLAQSWLRLAEHVARVEADSLAETAALEPGQEEPGQEPSREPSRERNQEPSPIA